MLHILRFRLAAYAALAMMVCGLSACTSPREYFRNGFKVGPNYGPPAAPLPKHWIDANDKKLNQQRCADLSCWWGVFNDPLMNRLIVTAYRQNLSLRQAGYRVLEARAQRAIAVGNIFPQSQTANGNYRRNGNGDVFTNSWSTDFNLSWELDFWGRFRRAVAAADDNLDASVADYDQAIVTLLADVAEDYVRIRTDQQRIKYLIKNVKLNLGVLDYIKKRRDIGFQVSDLEYFQALSTLRQTQAQIPPLVIDMRQAENRLCVLLGIPVVDLDAMLGIDHINWTEDQLRTIGDKELDDTLGPNIIPTLQPEMKNTIVINLPADLLRQRPDVRSAERLAAAQGEQIGIAQAQLYPSFSINGTLGYQAGAFRDLFRSEAFSGSVGPSFNWNILNYGRIVNDVRLQDATFRRLVLFYQDTVLRADQEVEDGIITYLRSLEAEVLIKDSADASYSAVQIATQQNVIGAGTAKDLTTYTVIQQNLVSQQDAYARAQGSIAQGIIDIYRALGGGWEIRFAGPMAPPMVPVALPPGGIPQAGPNVAPQGAEPVPAPAPNNPPVPADIPKPIEQPQP